MEKCATLGFYKPFPQMLHNLAGGLWVMVIASWCKLYHYVVCSLTAKFWSYPSQKEISCWMDSR